RERRVGCRRVGGSRPRELGARGSNVLSGAATVRRRWDAPNFARERPPDPAWRRHRPSGPVRGGGRRSLLLVCVVGSLVLGGCFWRGPRVMRAVTAEELLGDLAARRAAVTSLRSRGPLKNGLTGLWTRGALLVRRRAEETCDGALALRVAFDDYRDGFPHLVEVGAASGAAARLAYEAVERNAPVDPALFAPPPAARVLPLEAAPPPEGR